MTWDEIWKIIANWLLTTGIKLVIAFLFLFVAFKLINFFSKRILKRIEKKAKSNDKKFDKTVAHSLAYGARVILKILVIVCVIAYLGINVSAITAVLASTGLGIGLALNGALSNLAGGILLLITRPFKEDDFISADGYDGTVEHIRLCHTVLKTPDNKIVYIPNSTLSSSTVVNYSEKPIRRLDLNFSIEYKQDYKKAEDVILKTFKKHKLVLSDPAPMVRISEHGDNCIVLIARCWVKKEDFWTVKFDMLESIKTAFDQNGINIPFPQLDVHMRND